MSTWVCSLRRRWFDFGVALLLLLATAPALVLACILVRFTSGAPVFYRSDRVGFGGSLISILKIRTMRSGVLGSTLTVGIDERITPIGGLLRRLKIDELPQLWNVVRGDLALVGPRPESPAFSDVFVEYPALLQARPGITGPASLEYRDESSVLAGFADPAGHYVSVIAPKKARIDLDYLREATAWSDVRILMRTARIPLWPPRLRRDDSVTVLARQRQDANRAVCATRSTCVGGGAFR